MKNIHILPTEKPSKLFYNVGGALLFKNYENHNGVNIYITSDEEIKEDYVIAYGFVIKVMMFEEETLYFVNGTKAKREDCKKIILTTDQDLIKDGVQAIDDEFLEWFVKNPSCEFVEVEKFHGINTSIAEISAVSSNDDYNWGGRSDLRDYKIIIPKEETDEKGQPLTYWGGKEEPKQETIEEAAKRYATDMSGTYYEDLYNAFINCTKWQQEQDKNKYSDEDLAEAFEAGKKLGEDNACMAENYRREDFKEWFEKLKNK